MPDVFGHGSILKWSERQDFHLRPRGPKPRALKTKLRSDKLADPKGVAPSTLPQTTGRSAKLSYGSKMVRDAGNAPVVTSDVCFATPDLQAGSRNTSREVKS